jgi:hypothetical protein
MREIDCLQALRDDGTALAAAASSAGTGGSSPSWAAAATQ